MDLVLDSWFCNGYMIISDVLVVGVFVVILVIDIFVGCVVVSVLYVVGLDDCIMVSVVGYIGCVCELGCSVDVCVVLC